MGNSDTFTFRKFTIRQERCAMKVGTDGVLLGAWAEGGKRILDIGTGTGLIALMMAQRFPASTIDAIEIDSDAASQAVDNVKLSSFSNIVHVMNGSFQDFASSMPSKQYDSIVSNPPFFNNSLKNPDEARMLARHTDTLSFRDLFHGVEKLLMDDGVFSAIIPATEKASFISEASLCGLLLLRDYSVCSKVGKMPKRSLLAFGKTRLKDVENQTVTIVDTDGNRSDWYSSLTSAFYIK